MAVAMARRLRDHEKSRGTGRWIADLVTRSRQDADSATRAQQSVLPLYLHHYFAGENVEKLLRLPMIVPHLARPRGKQFFNNAQISIFHQMPAVAIVSPAIVLGILAAYRT